MKDERHLDKFDQVLGHVFKGLELMREALEAQIPEHLAVLADRAARRLTLREQTYVDYQPPDEVVEALRAEGLPGEQKAR